MRHGINLSNKLVNVFGHDADSQAELDLHTTCDDKLDSDASATDHACLKAILPTARFFGGDDVEFSAVAATPNTANEGELVVYRIGEADPSVLIADALARGAAGILTEQILPCPLPQCIVGDVESALAAITAQQLDHPDRKLLTVGVVGSAGKTSTALLLSHLLRSFGMRTAFQTDLGESDGVVQSANSDGIPSGTRLVEFLSDAVDGQCQATVIELSDEEARHGYYAAVEFDLLIVTGSTVASEDFGPSGLQCALEQLTEDGVVVAPADDEKAMQLIVESDANIVSYGIRKPADLSAKIIDQSSGMTTLLVTYQDITAVMETSLCGAGMAANHAATILTGLLMAQPLPEVVEKVSQLRTIPGRGQQLNDFQHADVILDVGGSPDRVATTLRTLRSNKGSGRLWCVLSIDGKADPTSLANYGTHLERFADNPVITAMPDKKPEFLSGTHGILDGVQKCAAFRLVADRQRAIEWALNEAKPNDTVLIVTSQSKQPARTQREELQQLEINIETIRAKQAEVKSHPMLKVVG